MLMVFPTKDDLRNFATIYLSWHVCNLVMDSSGKHIRKCLMVGNQAKCMNMCIDDNGMKMV